MRSAAFLTSAALAVLALLAPAQALADRFLVQGSGWMTYVNDRYGMSFDYPADIFVAEDAPQNGDGRSFVARGARLQIYAFHNTDDDTPAKLRARIKETEGYENVTYSPSGKTWLVVSGTRDSAIFYEKYAFKDGIIFTFGIDFPKDQKPYFAPIVERIENSFKAGHAD